jgi:hypothetical protein
VSEYRTVGDCLDAGVEWWQFAEDPWGGDRTFTSAEDAEAHRDHLIVDWPEEEYDR